MGNCADLFYSSKTEKETLHRRIMPSDEQRQYQADRWKELADYLCDWLNDKTYLPVKTWIQGSYKFGTQIRPASTDEEYDIDLGVYLLWEGSPDSKMYARTLKHHVHDGVMAYVAVAQGVKQIESPPKERCERIAYNEHFHIDLPSYHLDEKRDVRSLATETKGWECSDPKKLVVWFREKAGEDNDRTQLRRIIRYLKMWAALKFEQTGRPSSILLTVLATEAFNNITGDLGDDEGLCMVIGKIADRIRKSNVVPNPVDAEENLNRLDSVCNSIMLSGFDDFHRTAENAIRAATSLEAAIIWSEAFKHFFPVPEAEEIVKESAIIKSLVRTALPTLDIDVTATPASGTGRIYHTRNAIGPVPKNYTLKFEVVTRIPATAIVRWTARNSGEEADEANHLGHSSGTGIYANDSTAYNGTHHMDCSVFDSGRLIGFRRVPVIINDGMSRRQFRTNLVKFLKSK